MNITSQEIDAIVNRYEPSARVKDGPFVLIDPNDLFILLRLAAQHPREDIGGSFTFSPKIRGVKIK